MKARRNRLTNPSARSGSSAILKNRGSISLMSRKSRRESRRKRTSCFLIQERMVVRRNMKGRERRMNAEAGPK